MTKATAAAEKPKTEPLKPTASAADVKPAADPAAPYPFLAETDKPKPVSALLANSWKAREAGVFFNTFEVVPEAGTPIENLARPEYWANVSQKMRGGDAIIAFSRDGAWYAELLVWDAGQNWAHVSFKGKMERPQFEQVAGVADQFVIATDPLSGVVVKRKDTGAVVKSNFPNAEDARKWIISHQRALRS